MKLLIFQVSIPWADNMGAANTHLAYHPKVYQASIQSVSAYAERHGVCYSVLRSPRIKMPGYHPSFERLELLTPEFDCYDSVLYIDSDVVVKPDAPDPRTAVQDFLGISACRVADQEPLKGIERHMREKYAGVTDARKHVNTGVMYFGRQGREALRVMDWRRYFERAQALNSNANDQNVLNLMLQSDEFPEDLFLPLDWKFNNLIKTRKRNEERSASSYFDHYMEKRAYLETESLCKVLTRKEKRLSDMKADRDAVAADRDAVREKLAATFSNPWRNYLAILDYKIHKSISKNRFSPDHVRQRFQKAAEKRRRRWF